MKTLASAILVVELILGRIKKFKFNSIIKSCVTKNMI